MASDRPTTCLYRILRASALVGLIAAMLRIAVSVHSAKVLQQDTLALPIAIVIVGVVIVGIVGPMTADQRSRIRRLLLQHPGAHVWIVIAGLTTRFLVLDETTVAIVSANDEGRTWPLTQVRGASRVKMPARAGLVRRSGMRLAIGLHAHHETVDLLFPKWLGLSVSIQDTDAAVAAVQHAIHPPTHTART